MKRILFLDEDNSSRSQIAEAFARLFGADDVVAYSAGLRAAEAVDDRAVRLMAEIGCDLSRQRTKTLDAVADIDFDIVIGLGERRFALPASRLARGHWRVEDPIRLDNARYRDVRHDLGHRVRNLINAVEAFALPEDGSPLDLGSE